MKISALKVQKVFEKTNAGVGQVELMIESGSFVSIIGPSGCGKSTLLKMIAGLESLDQGKIQLGEIKQGEAAPEIGFVFQEAALLPWKNVFENVALPLELRGDSKEKIAQKVSTSLMKLGLSPFEKSYPHELSGGMKMRVSLARALVGEPKILLLDEPFSALDEPVRIELGILIRQLWQELKPTVILVTHSITEAVWLSERLLVMRGRPGKIVDDQNLSFPNDRPLSIRGLPEFQRCVEFNFNLLKNSDHP